MFNDRYGLTRAVLEGRKTMTRRIAYIGELNKPNSGYLTEGKLRGTCALCDSNSIVAKSLYKVGEVVAVAQAYKDIMPELDFIWKGTAAWSNKMFVQASQMYYHIRITGIRVERLQGISDEDCLREGVSLCETCKRYTIMDCDDKHCFETPREAFAALIDKVSGKGTWESNPYCFCYEFELIK